jgi:hypothetical protein
MRGRHKKSMGGGLEKLPKPSGLEGNPGVLKEAAKKKNIGVIDGDGEEMRMDRMARKAGGRVHKASGGSTQHPLSPSSTKSPLSAANKTMKC